MVLTANNFFRLAQIAKQTNVNIQDSAVSISGSFNETNSGGSKKDSKKGLLEKIIPYILLCGFIIAAATFYLTFFYPEGDEPQLNLEDLNMLVNDSTESILEIKDSDISESAICAGAACKAEYTKNIYPQYPANFFTRTMFLNYKPVNDANLFEIKFRNVLFIKNNIGKKAFIERPFPSDESVTYALCNEEFTECKVFDKFIYEEENMGDLVCVVINFDFEGGCMYLIDHKEIAEEGCELKAHYSPWPIKLNFLNNETFGQYYKRCIIEGPSPQA